MGLWFSASAVVPQLSDEWHLSDAGATWLTTSVQLGFVAGALASAILNLPDRMPLTRLIGCVGPARGGGERGGGPVRARAGARDPAAVPHRLRPGRGVPARDQAHGDVVSRGARLRRRGARRRARARLGHAAPRERGAVARLAGGARASRARSPSSARASRCRRFGWARMPPPRRRFTPATCAASSPTAPSGSSASATSATCGSSTRCGRGCRPTLPRASPHRATAIRPGRRSSWPRSPPIGVAGLAGCILGGLLADVARPGRGHDRVDGGERRVLRRRGGALRARARDRRRPDAGVGDGGRRGLGPVLDRPHRGGRSRTTSGRR